MKHRLTKLKYMEPNSPEADQLLRDYSELATLKSAIKLLQQMRRKLDAKIRRQNYVRKTR